MDSGKFIEEIDLDILLAIQGYEEEIKVRGLSPKTEMMDNSEVEVLKRHIKDLIYKKVSRVLTEI